MEVEVVAVLALVDDGSAEADDVGFIVSVHIRSILN